MVERDHQFKIRLSTEEVRWLEALAEQAGVTKTDYVRLLLRREAESRKVTAQPKRK
jgi:predicted DNA-binding protein